MPTKPIDRLALKDGILRRTCTSPLTSPNRPPTSSVAGSATHAQLFSVPPRLKNDGRENNRANGDGSLH